MTVAIGIIVTGVVGALSMVSGSVSASKESQTRVVAVGLAREGIEAVRVIRDSNWLASDVKGGPWDEEGRSVPPQQIENLNRKYGLNEPLWRQYAIFLENTVQGDLGLSGRVIRAG